MIYQLLDEQQLTTQLISTVEDCYLKAESFYNKVFIRPEINLNLRGNNAGTAAPFANKLRFNKQLLMNNQQHFLEQTVPHEVAHLIAYYLHGTYIRPHGKEWKYIMQVVYNLPAERCHHYKVQNKPKAYFIYQCACNIKHYLAIRRHNSMLKGTKYICKKCKQELFYTYKLEYK